MTVAQPGTADPEWLARMHKQLLADDSIQFDLPTLVRPEPPEWLKPLLEALAKLGPYMIYLFWGAVIIGVAIIVFLLVLEAKGVAWRLPWRRARKEDEVKEEWRPDAGAAQILLSEADALAARGDYDEAVHLLLRRSVADIATRLPDFLRPSLTARDIAAASSIPNRPRTAFSEIARIVEAALFARRPVGAEGWQQARSAYERFAFRDAWA
ncbi:MAG: DUF4129 domain-containing protein [Mesorhizobium sp.]|uniref:DUF4129 domain-containing protein n=1 Tax=Mesorhizobium sp. TaxID=1871066 RepID=UPI001217543F|nr:DUF4129 domain-containing protein [Mesorhizobium sp.]TIO53080.1 MAG: DUF4129 domain-containing protein [Mesorhizobium sp.]TIO61914.1 MAG: DUF4129 domain-containing protein [Mesorhizobium sp.]TJV66633.1 MAG: DUF4129 domain-containing protein [Mesorhizobium sp.]